MAGSDTLSFFLIFLPNLYSDGREFGRLRQSRWFGSPIPIAVLRSPAMVTSICNFSPEPGKNTPLVVLLLIASMAGGVDNG